MLSTSEVVATRRGVAESHTLAEIKVVDLGPNPNANANAPKAVVASAENASDTLNEMRSSAGSGATRVRVVCWDSHEGQGWVWDSHEGYYRRSDQGT